MNWIKSIVLWIGLNKLNIDNDLSSSKCVYNSQRLVNNNCNFPNDDCRYCLTL